MTMQGLKKQFTPEMCRYKFFAPNECGNSYFKKLEISKALEKIKVAINMRSMKSW